MRPEVCKISARPCLGLVAARAFEIFMADASLPADAAMAPPSSAGPSSSDAIPCVADDIFYAFLSVGIDVSTNTSVAHAVSMVLFSLLIVLGLGLLAFGARFQSATLGLALGAVFFIAAFVVTAIAQNGQGGEAQVFSFSDDPATCNLPLYIAIAAVAAGMLIFFLIVKFCSCFESFFSFLAGFMLGVVAMLVVLVLVAAANPGTFAGNRTLLYVYVGCTVLVALIAGGVAIYFMPLIALALRAATGGYCVAAGVSGVYAGASKTPFPSVAFIATFAGSAGVGALYQLWMLGAAGRAKRREEERAKAESLEREKGELFDRMDTSGKGSVTREEMLDYFNSQGSGLLQQKPQDTSLSSYLVPSFLRSSAASKEPSEVTKLVRP